jgi:hypothetical protein
MRERSLYPGQPVRLPMPQVRLVVGSASLESEHVVRKPPAETQAHRFKKRAFGRQQPSCLEHTSDVASDGTA